MKKWYLTAGILAVILGLLIIIFPEFWIKLIVTVLGLGAVGYGVYNLKITKGLIENEKYKKSIMIKSIVSIVAGVIAVLFPLALGNAAWTAMSVVLIIYLIGAAAIGFYSVSLLKDTGVERKRYVFENLILVGIAVILILISPQNLGKAIIRLIGIVVMIGGAGLVTFELLSKKKEIIVTEVEIKDDVEPEQENTEDSSENNDK